MNGIARILVAGDLAVDAAPVRKLPGRTNSRRCRGRPSVTRAG
ncbi:hypothetical protein [Azoarcus sp. DN11]|nr:hypothetical protein [Azoarcus sp. DN11]